VARALARAARRLARAGLAQPREEAAWLLARVLGTDRGGLLVRREERLPDSAASTFERFVERRALREPAQHILGTQEFFGLELLVDRRVLIPRPETEGLVEAALALDLPPGALVADLGTGSGCLAVTLAVHRPELRVLALDRSASALDVARANAERHGVAGRIEVCRAAFADPPPDGWRGRTTIVLSNPPYVSEAEWTELAPEVRDHDPREALVAGPTGLEAYREVVPLAAALAHPGGHLLLELGFGQAGTVPALLTYSGWVIAELRHDMQGIPRVLHARREPVGDR
jgi:release factor glutamine methyltransferase